jgi:Asp/Glu/hydantoin racemase
MRRDRTAIKHDARMAGLRHGGTSPILGQRRVEGKAAMAERILVVNPNSTRSCTDGIVEALAGFAAPGLPRLEVTQLEGGPPAVITWRDWFSVAEPLCRLAEREPAAAYVIACVSDPGVDAVRTVTRAPVFGPLRSAIAAALARADRFGIVAVADPSIQRQRRTLAAMGVEARIAGHIPLNLPMETLTDPTAPREALFRAARQMVAQGAEAVILGCAGMAGHRAAVEAACGVPVIEPCQAAAALAIQAVVAARPAMARAAE